MKRHRTRYAGISYRILANGKRRYSIDYKDSTGKRVWKVVDGNERDAIRARADIQLRMSKGERIVRTRQTIEELAEDYLRTQTGHLRPSTLAHYEYVLDHWVIPRLGERKLSEIDVNTIADFVAEMRQTLAPWTVRNCLKPLTKMFQYAMRRGWLVVNPVQQLAPEERPKGVKRKVRVLDTEEIQRLLTVTRAGYRHRNKQGDLGQALDGSYGLLFKMAVFTGLRKGELLALTWEDVNLVEGTVTVRQGKTEAASREVNIPDFLVKDLAAEMKTEGPVFTFDKRNVNRSLDAALERAGLEHIRFHDLRHTFASSLIGQGLPIDYVADQMGHASTSTTHKVYSHLFDGKKRKIQAQEKMQSFYEEVMGNVTPFGTSVDDD